MYKAYKAEFVLGLIGSILGIVVFIIALIMGLFISVVSIGYYAAGAIISLVLLLVAFIIGFVGTSKLNKNEKSGGVMLVVAGGLSLIALIVAFYSSWFSFFTIPLFLTGGIMALVRKPQAPPIQPNNGSEL